MKGYAITFDLLAENATVASNIKRRVRLSSPHLPHSLRCGSVLFVRTSRRRIYSLAAAAAFACRMAPIARLAVRYRRCRKIKNRVDAYCRRYPTRLVAIVFLLGRFWAATIPSRWRVASFNGDLIGVK